ncbi:MAG: GWxTD domain-containing protein [Bacteroidetes bacterium]|nr:GWxTD domain-containing protein [Bacteroidota bacterium]
MENITKYSLIILLSFLFSCQGNKSNYTAKPAKTAGNPETDLLEVNTVAYHLNDSTTQIFVEIKNENLIYKRPDTTVAFYTEIKIAYRLLSERYSKKVLDSGSYIIYDRSEETMQPKSLHSDFNIKAFTGNNYHLEISALDINKKTKYDKGLNVNKRNLFGNQSFLISSNNNISFNHTFLKDEYVSVQFSNPAITQVTVDCFFKEFNVALPPFSTKAADELKYKPDSEFVLPLSSHRFFLTMPEKGFYHVKPDAKSLEGLTLYTYDETFPGVSNSDEMINCTRYIMNREEFETCKNAEDKKAAIDNFWLNIGGSNERAKELLKRYYNRVKSANKNFSSYTQGWKTDRGMIYIVFGEPTTIYYNRKSQTWVYGNEANPAVLRFIFDKTQNPFSDNDFMLERSVFYKEAWYNAVDYWRQGNIYLDNRR